METSSVHEVEASEPLKNQCLHFLECIEHGTQPITDGQSGVDVVRVMEAIDRSVEMHGAPVSVAAVKEVMQTESVVQDRAAVRLDIEWVRQQWEVPADVDATRKRGSNGNKAA